jgi:SAM-dependent methyltransferase
LTPRALRHLIGRARDAVFAFADRPHPWYSDWALRYRGIARELERLSPSSVLEVGGNAFGVRLFSGLRVIATDISFAAGDASTATDFNPIIASAVALPIRSESVTALVCLDTFEHLSSDARRLALHEVLRVLRPRGEARIGFPCGTRAEALDRTLYERLSRQQKKIPAWLDEHMDNPFPTVAEFFAMYEEAARIARGTYRVRRRGHGTLWVQAKYIRLLIDARQTGINPWLRALLKLLVPVIERFNIGTCYRQIFVIERLADRPRDYVAGPTAAIKDAAVEYSGR